ncbi:MAG: ankyrin repeat domain-containing protein [Pyrinomonadaceae bacterium]
MSKKSFIDSVRVGKPCPEEWEKMTGNDRVRFCSHCAKDVKNLSAITRKQAARMVLASDGNICIRYMKNPLTEEPIFAGQLHRITRRSPALAVGIVSATLALSTAGYAQYDTPVRTTIVTVQGDGEIEEPEAAVSTTDPAPGSIEGFILDQSGTPVPGVTLMIVDADGSAEYATTDEKGEYRYDELEAGTYVIRISSSTGRMRKAMRAIDLAAGQKMFQNIYVKVAPSEKAEAGTGVGSGTGWGYGGVIAMVPYDLPLSRAVAADEVDEVRKLLAAGENVNGQDKNYDGVTPLFVAVENGNLEMVKLLLDHGADANAVDNTKRTPLMSLDSDATPELVERLIRAGAETDARDQDGSTVLLQTLGDIDAEVLGALITAGVSLNAVGADGETALMKAAEVGDIELVKALVEAGAKVNETDKSGESAWDKTSNTEIEKFLEVHGASADYDTIEVVVPAEAEDEEEPAER